MAAALVGVVVGKDICFRRRVRGETRVLTTAPCSEDKGSARVL
jgi:hypothetical protein